MVFVNPSLPFCVFMAYHPLHNYRPLSSIIRKESHQPHRSHPFLRQRTYCSFVGWPAAWLLFASLFISSFHVPALQRLVKALLLALTRMGTWPHFMYCLSYGKWGRVTWTRTGSLMVFVCAAVSTLSSQNSYLVSLRLCTRKCVLYVGVCRVYALQDSH